MFDDQVGSLFQRDVFAEKRHDLFRYVEIVENGNVAFIELDDFFLFRSDRANVFAHFFVDGLVVDANAAERTVQQIAYDGGRSVLFVEDQGGRRTVADARYDFFPAFDQRQDVVLDLFVLLSHRRGADDHAVVVRQHFRCDALEPFALFGRTDFLRNGYLVRKRDQYDVAPRERHVAGQTGPFRRDGLFGDLYQDRLSAGDESGYFPVLAHRLVEAHGFEVRDFLVVGQYVDQLLLGGELRAEIQVVDECVFFVSYVDERGVQPGHDLLDFSQIDIADGKSRFAFFLVQFDKLFVFEQGDGDFVGGYIDY